MTPATEPRNDTKLLLAIAATVAAGAVGITLLVGLRTEEPTPSDAPVHSPSSGAVAAPSARASFPRPAEAGEKLAGSTVGPEIEKQVETLTEAGGAAAVRTEAAEDPAAAAWACWGRGEFAQAAAHFEAATSARPADAYTWYMLGLSRWKSGDADGAAEALERSVERNPSSIRAFVNLSRVDNDRGEYRSALGAANRALEIDPESAVALYQRARSLRNLGRVDEALEVLGRCLELRADHGYALNLLGLIQLDRAHWAEALEAFGKAARAEPDVAFIHNNLGLALERNGRFGEALAAYRRAVEIDAGHATAVANLARLEPLVPAGPEAQGDALAALDPSGTIGEETGAGAEEGGDASTRP